MLVCSCKNTNKYRNKEENLGKIKNIFYLITRRAGTHYMYQPFLIHVQILNDIDDHTFAAKILVKRHIFAKKILVKRHKLQK